MIRRSGLGSCIRTGALALGICLAAAPAAAQNDVKILLDVAPRAVEYQLQRLDNDELIRVERSESDGRYRPVYYALLTRRGLGREYFDEALAALTRMEKSSVVRVLLSGLGRVKAGEDETAERLLRVLLSQPPDALRAERVALEKAAVEGTTPAVLRGAYGGLLLADGSGESTWDLARGREGHLLELLKAAPLLPDAAAGRAGLAGRAAAMVTETADPALRSAALTALAWARPDAATFRLLAQEIQKESGANRAAAIRALLRLPRNAWPAGEVEPLARSLAADLEKATPAARTEPAALEAIHLAEKLAEGLDDPAARALRRDLRALGVRVVRISTIPEEMAFDLRWFAVEAGKPVQIVLYNPDAMSHNLLVIKPGSLQEVGVAASAMSLPSDPKIKPYVPDSPLVLHATRLLNWAETERLSFTAPRDSGEYPFVCTFPGHWVRMYGVMLVVPDLEKWEASPTVPVDPMTGKPFPSQKMPM